MKCFAISLIRLYQKTISPDHGWFSTGSVRVCRFTPTCSEYTIQAIEAHGMITGCRLGFSRLLRCHPWHPGGHDPIPSK